jgi:hypothetical protein
LTEVGFAGIAVRIYWRGYRCVPSLKIKQGLNRGTVQVSVIFSAQMSLLLPEKARLRIPELPNISSKRS